MLRQRTTHRLMPVTGLLRKERMVEYEIRQFTHTTQGVGVASALYLDIVAMREYNRFMSLGWSTKDAFMRLQDDTPEGLGELERLVVVQNGPRTGSYLFAGDDFITIIECSSNVAISVASQSSDRSREVAYAFKRFLPVVEATPDTAPIRFWYSGMNGPQQVVRQLQVQPWEQVHDNYPPDVQDELGAVMGWGDEHTEGQLMLWHGVPGTGKTHAIRTLAAEWRGWARLDYIIDPDRLFGAEPHYLLEVLLNDDNEPKWTVLIMEDTGEMLAADAKEQTGQALSRLLNVTDGLIGQGLKVMVLVTTNEEVKKLHPAVNRPGRRASLIKFRSFDSLEARTWMEGHGLQATGGSATLADLYAKLHGQQPKPAQPMGFGTGGNGVTDEETDNDADGAREDPHTWRPTRRRIH